MRNGAGTRPPNSSGASGCGWRPPGGSTAVTRSARSRGPAGDRGVGAAVAAGLARGRDGGVAVEGAGVAGAAEPAAAGPAGDGAAERALAHGFADDQRWTLGRVKTLIGRLFHVGYTVQGIWKLLRRHGWSAQVPVRQAMERDDEAVEVWKEQVWPEIKARRADLGAFICFEDETGQGLRPPKGRTWAPRGARPGGEGTRRGRRAGQYRRGGLLPAR